ncbi:TPA: hypothetical protein ACXM6M_000648 [Serratia marcescens]
MDKLSELSNPAWIVGQQEIADFMRGDEALLVRGYDPESTEPALRMYSQEYVSVLLAERDAFEASALALRDEWRASKKSNAFLKEQLAQLANFNPDWDMLEACRESWREVAAALKETEAKLAAKDKCIAEAEVRGVEKLAAAFKSWASDETFPDYEAQRHWATASQEALSFAGDLRNGSCDDR